MKISNNKYRLESGFTLVELVTVIGILAIMSLFVFRQFGLAQDDAKFGIAQNVLLRNVPEAINSALQRYGNCSSITRERLVARGLNPQTPWGEDWTVAPTEENVTITYPMDTELNASDMVEVLDQVGAAVFGDRDDDADSDVLTIDAATLTSSGADFDAIYNCSATLD